MTSSAPARTPPTRHVTAWLALGFALLFFCLVFALLVPSIVDAAHARAGHLVARISLAVYLPLALFFLALGLRRGLGNPPQPFHPSTPHSIAIGAAAVAFLAFALWNLWAAPPRSPDISGFLAAAYGLYAAGAAGVFALRAGRSPLARPATGALHIVWAPFVPVGTALFLWWLLALRKGEARAA